MLQFVRSGCFCNTRALKGTDRIFIGDSSRGLVPSLVYGYTARTGTSTTARSRYPGGGGGGGRWSVHVPGASQLPRRSEYSPPEHKKICLVAGAASCMLHGRGAPTKTFQISVRTSRSDLASRFVSRGQRQRDTLGMGRSANGFITWYTSTNSITVPLR